MTILGSGNAFAQELETGEFAEVAGLTDQTVKRDDEEPLL